MTDTLTATLRTSQGTIVVRLFPDHAPKTVRNFVELAEGGRQWTDPGTGQASGDLARYSERLAGNRTSRHLELHVSREVGETQGRVAQQHDITREADKLVQLFRMVAGGTCQPNNRPRTYT